MTLEKAQVSDAQEILLLQKLAYKSEAELYNNYDIPPMTQTLKEIQNEFERHVFLKAVIDGNIIGSVRAFAQDKTCYIGRLVVHPDFQNKRLGTRLVNEIERLFEDCTRFELFTGHKSQKNFVLYQKLGYKIFKTKKITEQITLVYLEKIPSLNTIEKTKLCKLCLKLKNGGS